MTQTSAGEIEEAIGDLLVPAGSLDSVLASLGILGVFDQRGVKESQQFDYIVIGSIVEKPCNTLGRRGYDCSITIDVWSRAFSTKTVQDIVARLNQLIDQVHLNLATQAHVSTRYDMSQYLPQPDGLTLHAPVRYMLYIEE